MLSTLLGSLAVVSGASCAQPEPSERQLRARFISDRPSFEKLRALVNQQPRIEYLSFVQGGLVTRLPDGTVAAANAHDSRMSEVERLMRSTGTDTLTNGQQELDLILWIDPNGWRGQNAKGIAFAPIPRGRVVASIDEKTRNRYFHAGEHQIYSKVDGSWYVFFFFGD